MEMADIHKKYRLYNQHYYSFISTNFNGQLILSFYVRLSKKNGWKLAPFIYGLYNKPDIWMLNEIWFNGFIETNIDHLPEYKAFNSVPTKKTGC